MENFLYDNGLFSVFIANVILFHFNSFESRHSSFIRISTSANEKEEAKKRHSEKKKTVLFTFYVMFYKIVNGNWIQLDFLSIRSVAAIAISIHLINRMESWVDAFAVVNGFNFITCESTHRIMSCGACWARETVI